MISVGPFEGTRMKPVRQQSETMTLPFLLWLLPFHLNRLVEQKGAAGLMDQLLCHCWAVRCRVFSPRSNNWSSFRSAHVRSLWSPRHTVEYGSKHQKTNIQQDNVKDKYTRLYSEIRQ